MNSFLLGVLNCWLNCSGENTEHVPSRMPKLSWSYIEKLLNNQAKTKITVNSNLKL